MTLQPVSVKRLRVKWQVLCGFLLAVGVLGGCASWRLQKPEVRLADAAVVGGSLTESRLALTLNVLNKNSRAVTVERLSFDVLVGDKVLATGQRANPVTLVAEGQTQLSLEATARTWELLREAFRSVNEGGQLAYRLRGKAWIEGWGEVPFDQPGQLDVRKALGKSLLREPNRQPDGPVLEEPKLLSPK